MRQILHLLIVDRARRTSLVGRYGDRWIFPLVTCGERVRAGLIARTWCETRGLTADVCGQWLGRVQADATDWIVVVAASERRLDEPSLAWMPLDDLRRAAALMDYQRWALDRTVDARGLPAVPGPFGTLEWPDDVRHWVGTFTRSPTVDFTPYRVSAGELVLGVHAGARQMYFKGLRDDRSEQAFVTQRLAAIAPDVFPRTIARESRTDGSTWWLIDPCPGTPDRDGSLTARALASVQRRVYAAREGAAGIPALDLEAASQWSQALLADSPAADIVKRACARVTTSQLPETWIPMDIDPTNVLVDDAGRARFIDVDDSFAGPAPLAMALLARRLGRRDLYPLYEEPWGAASRAPDWRALEIVALAIEASLGWLRLAGNVGRGEIHMDLDPAAMVRRRLLAQIYRR